MTRPNDSSQHGSTNRPGSTLRARTDRRYIRSAHRSERFVLVELEAPAATQKPGRDPVNLAFVLDRSGSMSGQKIELAKRAIETAVDRLLPTDRFSIVSYDDRIDIVVEGTTASREAKSNAIHRLRHIDARGSTDLAGGWLRGAEQVALAITAGHPTDMHGTPTAGSEQVAPRPATSINRVLLLTDGLANVGITDPALLAKHAQELRARGVTTSTFGVGEDFDEGLLQSMADAGGGHFYFIANAAQIQDHIATEVGELLQVVARDAVVEVTAPEGLEIETLSPYPIERRGARHHVLLGDLVAEQRLEVVLRVRFGYGTVGAEVGVLVGATDRESVLNLAGVAPVGIGWEYADDRTNDAQPRDRAVDRVVARLFAARVRQDAVARNRAGDYAGAARGLRGVSKRIRAYAGSDGELQNLASELRAEEERFAAPMPEMTRKVAHAAASYSLRNRTAEGRAHR
jgi:Ca-activated chloride channel homolog